MEKIIRMKSLQFIAAFFLIFTSVLITSCETEPLDSDLLAQLENGGGTDGGDGDGDGGGTDGGGGTGGGSTTGDYWPTAINNSWIFETDGFESQPSKIVSKDVINNLTYYTFDSFFGQSLNDSSASFGTKVRIRKSSGNYYIKLEELKIDLGGFTGVQSGYEFLLLKDYLKVGEKWSGKYTQTTTYDISGIPPVSIETSYIGTILEKDISQFEVNGKFFSNVIRISFVQSANYAGTKININSEYWFAKGVGPIKVINSSSSFGITTSYTTQLISYTIN